MVEYTPIRNLKPGLKDLQLMCIVLDIGRPNITKEGHEVRTIKIADRTGSVNLSLWDEPGKLIASGDIVRLSKVYTNVWKNCLTLYIGKGGELLKIGEFCLVFNETPFMSEPNPELAAVQAQIQADRAAIAANSGNAPGKMFSSRNNNGNNNSNNANNNTLSTSNAATTSTSSSSSSTSTTTTTTTNNNNNSTNSRSSNGGNFRGSPGGNRNSNAQRSVKDKR